MSLDADLLRAIRAGLDHHNSTCPMPAKAIVLNTSNYELFDWDQLWGIPIMPSDDVKPGQFRIDCDGSANGIEDAVEEFIKTKAPVGPVKVPAGPSTLN